MQSRERDIARMERRFKRDGVVTPQERSQLRTQLTRLRDDVERMIRNERRELPELGAIRVRGLRS